MTEQDEPTSWSTTRGGPRPRVVVGIDFSAGARAALLFALQDAARRGVPVEAVVAYRPPDYWMDFYAVAQLPARPGPHRRAGAAAHVRRRRSCADGPQPPPVVRVRAAMGTAADVLIGVARRRPAGRRQPRATAGSPACCWAR